MAGRFLLRGEDDVDNPIIPRIYWIGTTAGRPVAYTSGTGGGRTRFIILLSQGARFSGDTGCNEVIKVTYGGFDLPEFDQDNVRNWKFHKGTIPNPINYIPIDNWNTITNRIESDGHGFAENTIIAFHPQNGDLGQTTEGNLQPHTKYKAINVTTDDYQLTSEAGSTPYDLTTAPTAAKTLAYAANGVGFFDAEQGKPEFMDTNHCFAGLCYMEVNLPPELSIDGEEPTKLKVMFDGKTVFDVQNNAGVLEFVGNPISGRNNFLIGLDAAVKDAGFSMSRFHAPTSIDFRDRCDELIEWTAGNDSAAPINFPTKTNVAMENVVDVRKTAGSGGAYDGIAASALISEGTNAEVEIKYTGGDVIICFASDAGGTTVIRGVEMLSDGTLNFLNGNIRTNIGDVAPTDRLTISHSSRIIGVKKNSVPFQLSGSDLYAPAGDFYAAIQIKTLNQLIERILVKPSGTDGLPRQVPRFTGGVVLIAKTPFPSLWENEIQLAAGVSWQDVDGQIRFLVSPDRTPIKTLIYDPNSPETSNVSKVAVKERKPTDTPNYWRFVYRNADDRLLTKAFHFVDRPDRREIDGYRQSQLFSYGVLYPSQMERIAESRVRLTTDFDTGFVVEGFLDSIEIAKGDFFYLVDPTVGADAENPLLCMVNDETLIHGSGVEVEQISLDCQIITNEFYSDTDHGAVVPVTHSHIAPRFLPPPPLLDLTAVERVRNIEGSSLSVLEGVATFDGIIQQSGRLWLRSFYGVFGVVSADNPTNELIAADSVAQTILEAKDGEQVGIVSAGGVLPIGFDFDTAYTLNKKGNGNFELLDDLAAVVEFNTNGTGELRIYDNELWKKTASRIRPSSDMTAAYSYEPLLKGFHVVRIQTESAAGVRSVFATSKTTSLEAIGDQQPPQPPTNLTGRYDGINVFWSFSPSPSNNVKGYQVRDENDAVIIPLINALTFVEAATTSTVRRRVFAVSHNGVVSATAAVADFQVPPTSTVWENRSNLDFDELSGLLSKSAASGYNAGAVLSKQLLSNQIKSRLIFRPTEIDKEVIYGLATRTDPTHPDHLRYAVQFKENGDLNALTYDATAGSSTVALGQFSLSKTYIIEMEAADAGGDSDINIIEQIINPNGTLTENVLTTFSLDPTIFPLSPAVVVYSQNAIIQPILQISGLLIPLKRSIPPVQNEVGTAYDTTTGTLTRKVGAGNKGASFVKQIAPNQSGIFEFQINQNDDAYVGVTVTDSDQTGADIDFALKFNHNGISPSLADVEVYIDNVFDENLGTFSNDDKWVFAREDDVLAIRKNDKIVNVYDGVNLQKNSLLTLDVAFTGSTPSAQVRNVRYSFAENQPNAAAANALNAMVSPAQIGTQRVNKIPNFETDSASDLQVLTYNEATDSWENTTVEEFVFEIGSVIENDPIENAVLYASDGQVANSDRFTTDGTDVFLRNTTDATVGSQQPKAPFLYFRTSRWNITNAVADDKQFRIGFQGTTTEYDHVTASKFSVEHYRDSVWYSLLELTNASSFLDTVLRIKSPVSPNVGGQIIFNASGAIKFQNLSGIASTLVASKFGANETFTVFANDPSVPYSPEIRSYFGSPIRFRDGQPGWFGVYSEGTHGGNSFVTIENPYGLRVGAYGTPAAMVEAESSTRDLFKLMYNSSNYMLTTVSNSGVVTLDAVGSGAKFVFADAVEVPDEAFSSSWDSKTQVPTKNAVFDQVSFNMLDYSQIVDIVSTGNYNYADVFYVNISGGGTMTINFRPSIRAAFDVKNVGSVDCTLNSTDGDTFNGASSINLAKGVAYRFRRDTATNWATW